jgi:hypothetical protein
MVFVFCVQCFAIRYNRIGFNSRGIPPNPTELPLTTNPSPTVAGRSMAPPSLALARRNKDQAPTRSRCGAAGHPSSSSSSSDGWLCPPPAPMPCTIRALPPRGHLCLFSGRSRGSRCELAVQLGRRLLEQGAACSHPREKKGKGASATMVLDM